MPLPAECRPAVGRRGRARARAGVAKGSGTRTADALALVKATPGISIAEIAAKMGIKQNYLYRVLPALADDGLVRKKGRGWHPAEPAAADTTDAGRTAKAKQA